MIYKNNNIPLNYNKIAEISDNYIVWVRESTLNSGTSYNAYVQYLVPSFAYFYTDNYRIKTGTNYSLDYNYVNSQFGGYIDSADVSYSLNTLAVDENQLSYDNESRSDYITLFAGQLMCCVCILWVFKQLSRLFFRGGLC